MIAKFTASLALAAISAMAYPTDAERKTVQEWDDLLVKWGYDYEMYTVTTDDAWDLTLFRITGKAGEATVASDKPPVLLQHGGGMDAASWISFYSGLDPMPMQLVSQGYDVWMGNNRGTRYSNVNPTWSKADNPMYGVDYATQNAAKFDFSFAEEGVYDLPAMINKITEVSAQPKITYIGYSQGTTQMIYGLTQLEDTYFTNVLNKAIFLAPCLYTATAGFEEYKAVYPTIRDHAINVIGDSNWAFDQENICDEKNADGSDSLACQFVSQFDQDFMATPIKVAEYYQQIAITDRFQQYVKDFSAGDAAVESDLVSPGLDSLDKVPIQFIVTQDDTECPASAAVRLHDEIATVKSYKLITGDNADHVYFGWNNLPEFMDLLVNQIELDPYAEEKAADNSATYLSSLGLATFAAVMASLF